jgi:uncharacterized membrane protein
MIAAVRPDAWNLPLLLHIIGAMVLVGALITVAGLLLASRRGDAQPLTRTAFRSLLLGAVPAFILMRVAAEWVASEEDLDQDAAWVGIGYIVSDGGLLLLIVATVLTGLGAKRAAAGRERGRGLGAATALTLLMLGLYVVAIWAMTAKPA